MKLSSVQKQAINSRFSCWVEASAGTGKTKVLTDRILNLLLAGTEVSDILCLTFTKAAGAEMANRLRHRLYQWATLDPAVLRIELEEFVGDSFSEKVLERARQLFSLVLDSPRGVSIQTIHGFCQFLLRTFPLEAGLLPHFKIMEEVEKKQLLEESRIELWKKLEKDDIRMIVEHFSEIQFHEFLDFFLDHKQSFSETSIEIQEKNLEKILDFSKKKTTEKIFFRQTEDETEAFLSFEKATPSDLKMYSSFLEFDNYDEREKEGKFYEYKSLFLTTEGKVRKRIFSKAVQKKFPDLSSVMEEEAHAVFLGEQSLLKKKIFEKSKLFMRVAAQFIRIYEKIKSQNSWLDYDDLILRTRDLLRKSHIKPWVLEKLDYKIKHILVDEAQDTSQVQWDLILALIEEFYLDSEENDRALFVVGDLKQSIYSFQGACPQAFDRAKAAFEKLPRRLTLTLSTSYRSTPAVLKFVDQVFKSLSFQTDERSYFDHQISRQGAPGRVEVWPLVEKEKKTESKKWSIGELSHASEDPSLILAKKIASQISCWLKKGEWLHSQNRFLEPKDIMILVRRRNNFMEEVVRALKEKNVPVTGLDRMVLTDQLVVQDLLCLCDVLFLLEDDLSLATLLKSPLFGLTEDHIFNVCHQRKEKSLWAYLKTEVSYETIVNQLLYLRGLAETKSPHAFFSFILSSWGAKRLFLERLGTEIEDVLEEFLSVCYNYESVYGMSLQRFVCWIRHQNIEIKRSLEHTNENKVRIMTIHGAKGLQAPVVFLPDTVQVPISRSSLYWQDAPPFLMWADRESRQVLEIENCVNKDTKLSEYYRLLYVALTRAEDRLYICGWESSKGVDPQSWYALLEATIQQMGELEESEDVGKVIRYGALTQGLERTEDPLISVDAVSIPSWLKRTGSSKDVPVPLKERSNISVLSLGSALKRDKGIIIHKILQFSIYAEEAQRGLLIDKYLHSLSLSDEVRAQIHQSVQAVFSHSDFSTFFNKKTRTEVSIQGYWENRLFRGVIDVLTVCKDKKEVYIVDYKTGSFLERYRTNPPLEYQTQLSIYKKIIQDIYPGYKVFSYLLWTEVGWIQSI